MPERVEATFVFGSLGNLPGALIDGWAVEDNYAWAIGTESRLLLPLPADEAEYLLRLTVQPLIHKGERDAQRLAVATELGILANFSLEQRTTIELALPIALTRNRNNIELILLHPDAMRPSDFKQIDDHRLLSVCFMSGTLTRPADNARDHPPAAACRLIVAGGYVARQIAEAISELPILRQRVACHYVNTDHVHEVTPPPSEVLQSAALCWEQTGVNHAWASAGIRSMLPPGCDIRRFAAPRMTVLWPFLQADPRLTYEAGLYPGGRYPFGDRIAASLAHLQLPDDVMQLTYMSMAETGMPDLDALLAADRAAWRDIDATHDIAVADYIGENFRRNRLCFAPPYPTGDLLGHMIGQLLGGSRIAALCDPAMLRQELDFLLTGYLGRREELPIHPQVAQRLGLAWWHPGMRYRWQGNRWTFEDYVLRTIRWTPWRP